MGSKEAPRCSEVLKEVATQSIYLTGAVKLTIKIQSWGAPDTFEVEASYLGELFYLALFLGVKFNILEVWIPLWNENTIESIVCASQLILVHIEEQEGGLPVLKLETVSGAFMEYFLDLQEASRAWSMEYFAASKVVPWQMLAKISANGQIGLITASKDELREEADQDDVKRVWNITRRFRVLNMDDFGGGLGEVRFPAYFNQHTHQRIFWRRKDVFRDENGLVYLRSLGQDAESEWQRMSGFVFNF